MVPRCRPTYQEPPDELGDDARTFTRVIASLQEEAEAIGWYEQRIALETADAARRIMEHAQREEFLHFDIVERAELAEDTVED